jgi:hypothetical protein
VEYEWRLIDQVPVDLGCYLQSATTDGALHRGGGSFNRRPPLAIALEALLAAFALALPLRSGLILPIAGKYPCAEIIGGPTAARP